ncbi:MAG: aminotransferase class III-fold pyridoxal phosphate-dependent enzyme [Opitutales bacterium]|nr:aminotransferase class III-fold pyridoxal phosphate-dependent enzyme [Opitutales bacterium]
MQNNSINIFKRAEKVIPGGIYGHVAPAAGLPDSFPHYCKKARGHTFVDVDGKDWIDFMCGFGTILHGYSNQEIETAAKVQREMGAVFNQPSEKMVELAEILVDRINFADWAVFAKNGSDLTTWAIRVARQFTQRPYIVKAKGAYHGVDAWCDPGMGGRIPSDRQDILEFEWNDTDQLRSIFKKYGNKIAGVILTPYHHPAFAKSEMPHATFWQEVSVICEKEGSLLILDDVRAGGRLHDDGSHRYFDFVPDLAVYSKALGNGYTISACVGKKNQKSASSEVFLTGSCWNDAVAMAAAITSLSISTREQVAEQVLAKGTYFCNKLTEVAKKFDIPLSMTGPASMPYPFIEDDHNLFKIQGFCRLCAGAGLYFHPHHNWFISNSHTFESLDLAIQKTAQVLEETNGKIDN